MVGTILDVIVGVAVFPAVGLWVFTTGVDVIVGIGTELCKEGLLLGVGPCVVGCCIINCVVPCRNDNRGDVAGASLVVKLCVLQSHIDHIV